jgi:hypothetical protein
MNRFAMTLGQYWINQLDNTIGWETAGDSILNIGDKPEHAQLPERIRIQISHKGSYFYAAKPEIIFRQHERI